MRRRNTLSPHIIQDLLPPGIGRESYTAETPGKEHSFRIRCQDRATLDILIKTPISSGMGHSMLVLHLPCGVSKNRPIRHNNLIS
jgi:hypothetical protein